MKSQGLTNFAVPYILDLSPHVIQTSTLEAHWTWIPMQSIPMCYNASKQTPKVLRLMLTIVTLKWILNHPIWIIMWMGCVYVWRFFHLVTSGVIAYCGMEAASSNCRIYVGSQDFQTTGLCVPYSWVKWSCKAVAAEEGKLYPVPGQEYKNAYLRGTASTNSEDRQKPFFSFLACL